MKPTKRERPGAPFPDETADLPVEDVVDAVDPLAPGQRIGRFVIRAPLGEGGMGVVLAAHDPDLDRPVAVKLVRDDRHPRHAERLRREARALARIEHPNVVRVYEVGSDRGRLFLAMELVEGTTLAAWLAAQRRTWREIVAMFLRVASGLSAVHRGGVVHRDFKPDNVLVDRAGTPRVADFGLARIDEVGTASAPEVVALTRTGVRMGTPGYMSPEQITGDEVDARADQYSFCVALGEAVFGREGREREDTAPRRGPAALRALVERGLASKPADRFASMDDLAIALRRVTTRTRTIAVSVGIAALAGGATAAAILASAPDTTRPSAAATPIPTLTAAPAMPDAASGGQPLTIDAPPTTAAPIASARVPSTTSVPTTSAPTTLRAVKAKAPVRHPEAVREAIRELGWGGITFTGDLESTARELGEKLAASTSDLDRGQVLFALAATERRRGDCASAVTAATDALTALAAANNDYMTYSLEQRTGAARIIARARFVLALCEVEQGRFEDARAVLLARAPYYFGGVERAERQFTLAVIAGELGATEEARQQLQGVMFSGQEVQKALGPRVLAYAGAAGI